MTITEIRCEATIAVFNPFGEASSTPCPHKFQSIDRPAFIAAQEFGWIVGGTTLCPMHAAEGADRVLAAMDAERSGWGVYGRHSVHNVTDRVPPGEPFIGDPMLFARAYFEEHPDRKSFAGRQRCRESGVVLHARVSVAELRGALHA